jgi:hypothetical protein
MLMISLLGGGGGGGELEFKLNKDILNIAMDVLIKYYAGSQL